MLRDFLLVLEKVKVSNILFVFQVVLLFNTNQQAETTVAVTYLTSTIRRIQIQTINIVLIRLIHFLFLLCLISLPYIGLYLSLLLDLDQMQQLVYLVLCIIQITWRLKEKRIPQKLETNYSLNYKNWYIKDTNICGVIKWC